MKTDKLTIKSHCKYAGKNINPYQFKCLHPTNIKKEKFPVTSDDTCNECKLKMK